MTQAQKTVLFFGDSLFRRGFEEEGGFMDFIRPHFDANDVEFIHRGVDGDKIYDLLIRIDEALSVDCDLVFVNTGTNDVNHKSHHDVKMGTGTEKNKYKKYLDMLVKKLKEKNPKVVLCNPAVTGEDISKRNIRNEDLDLYCSMISEVAEQNAVSLCDIRHVFKSYLSKNNPDHQEKGILTLDGVHLNPAGQRLFAETLLPYLKAALK